MKKTTIANSIKKQTLLSAIVMLFCVSLFAQKNIFDVSRSGTIEEIQALYKETPNIINLVNENGYSPLVLACYNGNDAIVTFLADKVDNINGTTNYGSPLMAATVKGYIKIVNILLKHKADPNITDAKGVTAGHYAVMFRKYSIIEMLVEANADFNLKDDNGKSALDYAKNYNDEKINKLLNIKL